MACKRMHRHTYGRVAIMWCGSTTPGTVHYYCMGIRMNACADMCVDMVVENMRRQVSTHLDVDECVDMCMHIIKDRFVIGHTCVDVCVDMGVDMCADMGVDMCVDMLVDMCADV